MVAWGVMWTNEVSLPEASPLDYGLTQDSKGEHEVRLNLREVRARSPHARPWDWPGQILSVPRPGKAGAAARRHGGRAGKKATTTRSFLAF